jgi:hypothetical protein
MWHFATASTRAQTIRAKDRCPGVRAPAIARDKTSQELNLGALKFPVQSGNLSSAQQNYSSLQQQFEQFTQNNGPQAAAPPSFNNFSVNV